MTGGILDGGGGRSFRTFTGTVKICSVYSVTGRDIGQCRP